MRLSRSELLVVCLVGLLVLSLLFPFLQYQRASARSLVCQDRLGRLAIAAQAHDATVGHLPGFSDFLEENLPASWTTQLLPHLTTADPNGTENLQRAYAAFVAQKQGPSRLPELLCPAQEKFVPEAPLSYVANCGQPDVHADETLPPDWQANGLFFQRDVPDARRVTTSLAWLSAHDGQKVTLLLSENVDAGPWHATNEATIGFVWAPNLVDGLPSPLPTLWPINQHRGEGDGSIKFARPASEHAGVANGVMASGTVQAISDQIDYLVFQRMLTADGANVKAANQDAYLPAPWRHAAE